MDKAVGSFIAYQKEAEERYQSGKKSVGRRKLSYRRKNERNGESMKFDCSRCWVICLNQAILLLPITLTMSINPYTRVTLICVIKLHAHYDE